MKIVYDIRLASGSTSKSVAITTDAGIASEVMQQQKAELSRSGELIEDTPTDATYMLAGGAVRIHCNTMYGGYPQCWG